MNLMPLFKSVYSHCIVIALAVIAAYAHTLDVPFYLDDHSSIVSNPAIHQGLNWQNLSHSAPLRIVSYASLALNFQWHQLEVAGYHIVNTCIHILAAISVLVFSRGLVQTPALTSSLDNNARNLLPITTALLFALHPLQTQAVTYIVQRSTSLAAFFYIASIATYVEARTANRPWFWGIACVACAILAFFTKQNTLTLPFAIILIELVFFPDHAKNRRLVRTLVIASIVVGLSLTILAWGNYWDPVSILERYGRETDMITRQGYLASQLTTLWLYVKLLFWPFGLHLDYETHQYAHWSEPRTLLSLFAHILVLAIALHNYRKVPIICFGTLFYYLAHSIESGVIPIKDIIFEHRTYLPNLGPMLIFAFFMSVSLPRILLRYGSIISVSLLIGLMVITWQRNQIWRDPVQFWRDNSQLEPGKIRPRLELARALSSTGRDKQAMEVLRQITDTVTWQRSKTVLNESTAINLVTAFYLTGRYAETLRMADYLLNINGLSRFNQSRLYQTVGDVYRSKNSLVQANKNYQKAIQFNPNNLNALLNSAKIKGTLGGFDEAIKISKQILVKQPALPATKVERQGQ